MNTITVRDTSGNDVEITEEELNSKSCFVLGSNMSALVTIENENEEGRYMETRLILPKPANDDEAVPVSAIFITSISIQARNPQFIQQNIDWLRTNMDRLKAEAGEE